MASVRGVLALAASQIGYVEKRNNITKYWAALKPAWQGGPWCATFVQWVLIQKGNRWLMGASLPFYCPSLEQFARKEGRWFSSPRPGDVAIFGYRQGVHTGFVERVLGGGWVQTVEGNTSSGSGGSQTDGGGVYRRVRHISWCRGFIRPNYSQAPGGGAPQKIAVTGRIDVPTTRLLQQWLNKFDEGLYTDLRVDGDNGPLTRKKLQWMVGSARDGEHGPDTQRKLEDLLHLPRSGAESWTKASIITLQQVLNAAVENGSLT